jgi:hypothetical protein
MPLTTADPDSMVIGVNGNLYTLEAGALNGYAAIDGTPLFAPVTPTGLSGADEQLFAFDKGIIVASPSGVEYFTLSGRPAGGPYPLTASATAFPAFAAQPNGDLFAAGMTSGIPFNACNTRKTKTMLEKVTPSGRAWLSTLPWKSRCNGYGLVLNTVPNGGVIVSSATDTGHGGYQYVNAAGVTGWYSETTGPAISGGSMSPYPPQVDTNGDLVAENSFGFACNLRSDDCAGVQIDRLGPNGQLIGAPILLQGPTNKNQVTWEVGSGGVALVPGHASASLEFINGGRIFGTRSYGLYSFGMRGLGAEYPQSVLWGFMPTSFQPQKVIHGPACPDVMILATRGSGESPKDWTNPAAYVNDKYRGAGEVNWSVYTGLTKVAPKLRISLDPITYPADSVADFINGNIPGYFASVSSGTETLLADMQLTDSKCGGTVRYILSGYSQGAWAIHDALYQMKTAQLNQIAGVALFGDPDFKPAQPIVRDNKSSDTASGVATAADPHHLGVPPSITSKSGSWCYPTDPICQFTKDNIKYYGPDCLPHSPLSSLCPHFQYVSGGETAKATTFLAMLLPKTTLFPQLTLTPPPNGTVGHPYTWTATASCSTPCTWSTNTAKLPPGLAFSSTGILTDTPTQAGTYPFPVTATARYGRKTTGGVTVIISN